MGYSDKNIGIETDIGRRNELIFYCMLLMPLLMLVSRAALSVIVLIFLVLTLVHSKVFDQLRAFWSQKPFIAISLLFLIPFVSFLWSDNSEQWLNVMQLKVPLLLLPLAFAGRWRFTDRRWMLVAIFFLGAAFIGSAWSIGHYLLNTGAIHQGYLKAKTLFTPFDNDHVRFSWLITVAVIVCFLLLRISTHPKWKWTLAAFAVYFTVYLHILSTRTGLLTLYIFFFIFACSFFISGRKKSSAFFLMLIVVLPLAAWLFIPTFQNRVKYLMWDMSRVKEQVILPGSNDGARLLSIRAGTDILREHPFGAGAGDLSGEVDAWYRLNASAMPASDRFLPCSEWLVYGGFAGWPGIVLFTAIMILPLFYKTRYHWFWISLNVTAASTFIFDTGLEIQYGIFLYAFTVLASWKWLAYYNKE